MTNAGTGRQVLGSGVEELPAGEGSARQRVAPRVLPVEPRAGPNLEGGLDPRGERPVTPSGITETVGREPAHARPGETASRAGRRAQHLTLIKGAAAAQTSPIHTTSTLSSRSGRTSAASACFRLTEGRQAGRRQVVQRPGGRERVLVAVDGGDVVGASTKKRLTAAGPQAGRARDVPTRRALPRRRSLPRDRPTAGRGGRGRWRHARPRHPRGPSSFAPGPTSTPRDEASRRARRETGEAHRAAGHRVAGMM